MDKKVKVYSTPTCPYCDMAKQFLRDNDVKFDAVDVSKDRAAAAEMIEETGQMGVPVIKIGGEYIIGFDREAIKKALNLK
ncbi:MAG: glutaredoxin family protein [Nanoarchaeota archaeon]|nr:glutaredoxin family protein [Nanoarchaeota archaeon]